jgi:hypothetical protein
LITFGRRALYYRDHVTGAEPSAKPVPGADVGLTGTGSGVPDSATTDGTGGYVFPGKPLSASYTLTPNKQGDFAGAVSSFDAAQNAQAVVGLITLTPFQLLAADVSGNGTATSFDSSLIAQFAVGSIIRFPVAERLGSDWFMVPAPAPVPNQSVVPPSPAAGVQGSISLTPLESEAAGQDFIAGLFGDITGNYVAAPVGEFAAAVDAMSAADSVQGGTGSGQTGSGKPEARLRVSSATAAPGDTVRVAITADGAESAVAFDLALTFDPAVLRPVQVEAGRAASAFTLTPNFSRPGQIRLGLFDSSPLAGSGEIAVLTFQVVGQAGDETALGMAASLDEGRIVATVKEGRIRVRSRR